MKKTLFPAFVVALALGGCASPPPISADGAASPVPTSAVPAQTASAPTASAASASESPVPASPDSSESQRCDAVLGQAQAYLNALLATDRKLADACLSRPSGSGCWSRMASTLMAQDEGLDALPADCPAVRAARRPGHAYLRAAARVARDCAVRGAPGCLTGAKADAAKSARSALNQALGNSLAGDQ